MNRIGFLFLIVFFGKCSTCEDAEKTRTLPRSGAVRINSIRTDLGIHADVATSITGQTLIFDPGEFVVKPAIGDSMYKAKGKAEYVLIRNDSTFIQRWDCKKDKAIIVEQWANQ